MPTPLKTNSPLKIRRYIFIGLLPLLASNCKEEEAYPDILTEFANMHADKAGISSGFTLDNGTSYSIANPVDKLRPEATYRVVVSYALDENRQAKLFGMEGVHYLRDSSSVAKSDPTGVFSAWRAGSYINLHLTPTGQDGEHYWGFCLDSLTTHHAHLSLHHDQNGDPASYSSDVYASIPVDSIKGITEGDTITLNINTFKGRKEWKMMY